MRAIRPRAGHRAERQQQHRRGPQRQQHQVRLVPEADIRGITPQQRLAAAGADALCKKQKIHKKRGRRREQQRRDEIQRRVQQRGRAHGAEHTRQQQIVIICEGEHCQRRHPDARQRQQRFFLFKPFNDVAAHQKEHQVANVAHRDDEPQLRGRKCKMAAEYRRENAAQAVAGAEPHHQHNKGRKGQACVLHTLPLPRVRLLRPLPSGTAWPWPARKASAAAGSACRNPLSPGPWRYRRTPGPQYRPRGCI